MASVYRDIMYIPIPISNNRPHMSMLKRAAQFAPFAALTGFGATIIEAGRLTANKVDLCEDMRDEIDYKLSVISEHIEDCPTVTITYFLPDQRKAGGAYLTHTGEIISLDDFNKEIILSDGSIIPIANIRNIEGNIFDVYYMD